MKENGLVLSTIIAITLTLRVACGNSNENGATTFSITTFNVMTLSITTLSITTLSRHSV
jgi:hypothetical protein